MGQFIGLDIHRKFIQVCVMDQMGVVSQELRLELEEPDQLREFFRGFDPQDSQAVMEATIGWMWLADELQALGIEVHLAHMQGVRLIAESHRKTDRIDARILADLLRTDFLPEAYLAPPQVREDRMVLRHRQGLVAWRTAAKNRVHALLARYNIHLPQSDIFGAQGLKELKALEMPVEAARIRDEHLLAIEFLNGRIQVVEKTTIFGGTNAWRGTLSIAERTRASCTSRPCSWSRTILWRRRAKSASAEASFWTS